MITEALLAFNEESYSSSSMCFCMATSQDKGLMSEGTMSLSREGSSTGKSAIDCQPSGPYRNRISQPSMK